MGLFRVRYTLPNPTAADVQTQTFKVEASNSQELREYLAAHPEVAQGPFPLTFEYPATQPKSDWIYMALPDTITVSLNNIDKSGNASPFGSRTYSDVDDVAPPAPDPSGINVAAGDKEQVA